METIRLIINERVYKTDREPMTRLLDFLREELHLMGTKESCGVGECGACTVLVDEQPMTSCLLSISKVEGKIVKTVEFLSETELGKLIIDAYNQTNAVQCGFCFPGFMVTTYAYIKWYCETDREKIRQYFSGNLCRCTGYQKIIDAVMLACEQYQGASYERTNCTTKTR